MTTNQDTLKIIMDRAAEWRADLGVDFDLTGNHQWESAHATHHSPATISALVGAGDHPDAGHDDQNTALAARYVEMAADKAPRSVRILLELEDGSGGFDANYFDPSELFDKAEGIDDDYPESLTAREAVARWLDDKRAGRA